MKMDVAERVPEAVPGERGAQRWAGHADFFWTIFRIGSLAAWLTLLASLAFTGWAWRTAVAEAEAEAQGRFDFRAAEIKSNIVARMAAYEQVLRGARGLFEASGEVTRAEWRTYVRSLRINQSYPGIQGIGFAKRIPAEELPAHLRDIRAEGFPGYHIRPEELREEYTSIIYLEPFDWRNRRAFGYDMFTEPVRRAAMIQARDAGDTAISGKVKLVQETERDVQPGFLMYLPLYRKGASVETESQRREALLGYVYSPFRMRNLMAGILGRQVPDLDLRIRDGAEAAEDALMYDSHPESLPRVEAPRFSSLDTVEINGHPWTLMVSSLPAFEATVAYTNSRLILAGGTAISLLVFVVVASQASLRKRALALARDMTAALRESREQFQAVAETANDAVVSADARGRIVYFNRAAERMFGHQRAQALGQPLTLLMPARFHEAHRRGFQRFLASGESHLVGKTMELTAADRDGAEFPIEISLADWATAKGVFFTAIVRDISERVEAAERIHRLNAELEHQVAQLAAANQELESFSYSVSHDLRTPLRAVDGFARILEEEHAGVLDEDGRRLLTIIQDNARRMGHLIDDLLAFSRLGRKPLAGSRVDMAELAAAVREQLQAAGEARAAAIAIGELPRAWGDGAMLQQVWLNLLSNAVKFTGRSPTPAIEAGGYPEGEESVYFVKDNGVGFDMRYADKLFGVFQRLHSMDEFPGTGVGLAIVKRVVTRHGGRVWADARPGEGAVFHFSLPRVGGVSP